MQPIMSVRILWDVVNASGLCATAHAVLFELMQIPERAALKPCPRLIKKSTMQLIPAFRQYNRHFTFLYIQMWTSKWMGVLLGIFDWLNVYITTNYNTINHL